MSGAAKNPSVLRLVCDESGSSGQVWDGFCVCLGVDASELSTLGLAELVLERRDFDAVVLDEDMTSPAVANVEMFGKVIKRMKPGSRLLLTLGDGANSESIKKEMLLSGFVKFEDLDVGGRKVLVGYLPSVSMGGGVLLSGFGCGRAQSALFPEPESETKPMIDPFSLLLEEDFIVPDKKDCSTGSAQAPRKACKNCTCGLSEELEKEHRDAILRDFRPSCGNCFRGDAFRCASCPYYGLPPSKPGENIKFDVNNMGNDV